MTTTLSLAFTPNLFFVGIKGKGMCALAILCKHKGFNVAGSDVGEVFDTDHLLHDAQVPFMEFGETNLSSSDVVIHSVAYTPEKNADLALAKHRNIPTLTYPQALGALLAQHVSFGATGCHGKSTTSSMMAYVLEQAGEEPSFVIGATIAGLNVNTKAGKGETFVIEADEYREAFVQYAPHLNYSVITTVDWDHPDYYHSFEEVLAAYERFVQLLPTNAIIVACGDDAGVEKLLDRIVRSDLEIITYGFGQHNHVRVQNKTIETGMVTFDIDVQGEVTQCSLRIPGDHNVLNATAALLVLKHYGLDSNTISQHLAAFGGAIRRFEYKGERDGIVVLDDYAHHPTEIGATLSAARDFYPNSKIWAVFKPHTFTRTKQFLSGFAEAFVDADTAVIMDIFPSAREDDTGDIHAKDIVNRSEHTDMKYIGNAEGVVKMLHEETAPGDVVITMGAEEVYRTVAEAFLHS